MRYYIVDVFSDTPFRGNPVAVVFSERPLEQQQMQGIAAWFNLSETTFVNESECRDDQYGVQIFTPGGELPFAGHPTLGTATAVRAHFKLTGPTLYQECQVGRIPVRFAETGEVFLLAPEQRVSMLSPEVSQQLGAILGADTKLRSAARVDVGPVWMTALFDDAATVSALQPDLAALTHFSDTTDSTGATVAAPFDDGKTWKVRSFAPRDGIPEDPVCGSGNISVAALRAHLEPAPVSYRAKQGQEVGRDGEVEVVYQENGAIELGGSTLITARGELTL